MKQEALTDALLREFLIGNLDDEQRDRIESQFLTDAKARERILAVEQDLIEDYLEESLTTAEKERFLHIYGRTAEQRQKLRITKSIKDWAVSEASVLQAAAAPVPIWSRFWTRVRVKPLFIVPIAATVVVAIVLALVWLNSKVKQSKHLAVEQELAEINSPGNLREVPSQMVSLDLKPVTVRSVEMQTGFNLRADVELVELRLAWIQKQRYSAYQAELRRLGDDEVFRIPNLQAENDGAYTIRVRVPAHILSRGSYQIQIKGINNDGSASPAEEYHFAVRE